MNKDFFSFEKLNGAYAEIGGSVRFGVPAAVFGLSDADKFFIASLIKEKFIYIAQDPIKAKRAAESIGVLSGEKTVYIPPKDEVLLYKNALSKDSLYGRINALYEISRGAKHIVCDIESALQLFPKKIEGIVLEKGREYDYASLPEKLVSLGYSREYEVEAKGCFAVRGDILDIYPVNAPHPYRIDFFGDEVECVRPYDEETKERLPAETSVDIAAASDVFVREDETETVKNALKEGLKAASSSAAYTRMAAIADEIGENMFSANAADFLMPLLSCSTDLFSFVGKDALVLFDEGGQTFDRMQSILKEHNERFVSLRLGGEAFPFSVDQLLSEEKFEKAFSSLRTLSLQTFASSVKFFSPLKTFNFKSVPVSNYMNDFTELFSDISAWLANQYRILLFCGESGRAQRMRETLGERGIVAHDPPVSCNYLAGVTISEDSLERGFISHENKLVVIGSGNLYVKAVKENKIRRRRGDVFTAPEIGDYAVHEVHGVGKVLGTKKIETLDGTKEYIAVQYGGGDILYVPVEQTDILTKYTGGDEPKLSKIGGQDFARVKERVRSSLKKLAIDLKALYAERAKKQGYAFPENKELMDEFAYSFPYTETPDQTASIEEILKDMRSTKVMDRLLCGDVGFGKTEVALRAVYLCVLGKKQAALMCPSTILSQQHYNTAVERFKDFGVNVEIINRFKTPKEQEDILKRLAEGKIDLLIGTHRLLSKDVKFYDLGLLVLDEEQRFGVEHKEKLKTLKNKVDCLTMSATPIPRTLHMSLSGIRDISTIDTPPEHRIPVQTYVVEESETVIRDACIRELARGGQIFVLYNRVETIYRFADRLKAVVPEAEIAVAHGKMEKAALEKNVQNFYEGKVNLLVTTTIIENGIDLSNANTIVVVDADRLGVSQLYQLRGRVGRGNRMAHAYFTYKPEKVMTAEATERLKAVMEFTQLGSGFKIAMRDLQIRGAGNVLGAEQHGHMDKVGYELYAKLLKEELTGEEQTIAELEINASAFIPEKYIEASSVRMDAYKQIAEIRSMDDYNRVYTSLKEMYGALPDEVFNLLVIAVLKSYAAKFAVKKIVVNSKRAAVEFSSLNAVNNPKLNSALSRFQGRVSLSMVTAPAVEFIPKKDPVLTMREMIKFLKYAEVSPV